MSTPYADMPWRCRWCLEARETPNEPCPCCGADYGALPPPACRHRAGRTLDDLFKAGVRLVRRDPWAEGNYLELQEAGGFMKPWAALCAWTVDLEGSPRYELFGRTINLWEVPRGGWEPYSGRSAEDLVAEANHDT